MWCGLERESSNESARSSAVRAGLMSVGVAPDSAVLASAGSAFAAKAVWRGRVELAVDVVAVAAEVVVSVSSGSGTQASRSSWH